MNENRLLIIDDEAGFRNYVRRVGETAGFEAHATDSAVEFIEKVRTWHPTVIVLDLNMPGSDGVELLRHLADAKCKARILIASGVDAKVLDAVQQLAKERGLTIGGTLAKPIRAALLKDTLDKFREFETPLLTGALAHAIAHDELLLEYQPKLDSQSGRIYGVEALVRWQHPTRGIIPPDQFIPLAEQSDLIDHLTVWVIAHATAQAAQWRQAQMPLEIAINLSARNLDHITLPDTLAAHCATARVSPDEVTLEITESAAMGDPTDTMDVLTRLRLKGFHLSIDDFGTGYSSLVQLRRLPLSEIKIDKSFVMRMADDQDSRVIVEAVAGLGQKLGLKVIAEGVETAANVADLRALGVDALQGYFISRPVSADKIPPLVTQANGDSTTVPLSSSGRSAMG